jgi:hypothetical protein
MIRTCSTLLLTFFSVGSSLSQETVKWIPEELPRHIASRIYARESGLFLHKISVPDRAFVQISKLWNTSTPIRVCFFGGTNELNIRIVEIASQWSKVDGYIPLDFLDENAQPRQCDAVGQLEQIRIGFQYRGYWSTVGSDSVSAAPQYEQSMNYALFDTNPPEEPEFSRVVLHEFGHALGLQHEHQGPSAPCVSEFDWDAIYAYLAGSPNYWSREQIDHNLKPRISTPDNVHEIFDVKSIMLYSFPEIFYKSGTNAECFTEGNSILSEIDIRAMEKFYPRDIAKKDLLYKASYEQFTAAIEKLEDVSEFQKSVAKIDVLKSVGFAVEGSRNWEQPALFFDDSAVSFQARDIIMNKLGSQIDGFK